MAKVVPQKTLFGVVIVIDGLLGVTKLYCSKSVGSLLTCFLSVALKFAIQSCEPKWLPFRLS